MSAQELQPLLLKQGQHLPPRGLLKVCLQHVLPTLCPWFRQRAIRTHKVIQHLEYFAALQSLTARTVILPMRNESLTTGR